MEVIEFASDGHATYRRTLTVSATGRGKKKGATQERTTEEHCVDIGAVLACGPRFTRLPFDCAFHERAGDTDVFVIEHPPQTRTFVFDQRYLESYGSRVAILTRLRARDAPNRLGMSSPQLDNAVCSGAVRTFHCSFPYTVLAFRFRRAVFERVYLYFRTAPLEKPDDVLLAAPLPNLNRSGMACIGNSEHFKLTVNTALAPADQVAVVESQLWGSTWNAPVDMTPYDSPQGGMRYPKYFESPWEWELRTREDPMCALTAAWRPIGMTIGNVVDGLLHNVAVGDDDRRSDPLSGRREDPGAFIVARERIRAAAAAAAARQKAG